MNRLPAFAVAGVIGIGLLLLAGQSCASAKQADNPPVQTSQLPPIDAAQPKEFSTATFSAG
ncbi:hypothetical protein JW859_04110 [bacterium]|nr:hypothetical protein [bacterium]